MEERLRTRNLNFLNHNLESFQTRREQFAVELRKEKRSKNICKKREKMQKIVNDDQLDCLLSFPAQVLQYLPSNFESFSMLNKLQFISQALKSQIPDQVKENLLEKIDNLVRQNKLELEILYNIGFANSLINILNCKSNSNMIISSMYILWCIINSNNEYIWDFYNDGLLDKVISFVCPGDVKVLDYAIWLLAAMSDEERIAIILLKDDILIRLIKLYNCIGSYINSDIIDDYGILLLNITAHNYEFCKEDAKLVCQIVIMIMKNKSFSKAEFIKSLYYLCRKESLIEIVIASKVMDYVYEVMGIPENTEPAFELLGIISSGNSTQIEYLYKNNILDTCYIYALTDSYRILKNIMITINNIACESAAYIPLIISHNVFPLILPKLIHNIEGVRIEASYLLSTIMTRASNDETLHIIQLNIGNYIEQAFKFKEPEFLYNCLIISIKIINLSSSYPDITKFVDIEQLISDINNLATNTNKKVSELAETLLSSNINHVPDEPFEYDFLT
ncbi:hypothetical protein SteCoe_2928 [Stentor coeruleus]|uniref:IBB domain-containing protein n=1 Tax=Stentor coeruleus TaxID=5963 RepID=A0A1R2CYF0_9CILI|nr:hypothetical protein SteCoe_2928 [Stentor coeruleus]